MVATRTKSFESKIGVMGLLVKVSGEVGDGGDSTDVQIDFISEGSGFMGFGEHDYSDIQLITHGSIERGDLAEALRWAADRLDDLAETPNTPREKALHLLNETAALRHTSDPITTALMALTQATIYSGDQKAKVVLDEAVA